MDDENIRCSDRKMNGGEVFENIIGQRAQASVCQVRRGYPKKRISVWISRGHHFCANYSARSRSIFNDHLLAETCGELCRRVPRSRVQSSPRCKWDDRSYDFLWIVL